MKQWLENKLRELNYILSITSNDHVVSYYQDQRKVTIELLRSVNNTQMKYTYSILDFDVVKGSLVAHVTELYDSRYTKCFSNKGKQFFVINNKSNNFRRFRLFKETEMAYLFKSEDNINCLVVKF